MRLYSYVVASDSGFAPNPFWRILTLACCKPKMRLTAKPGDLLVGLAGAGRDLRLTATGASTSEWLLPAWFEPVGGRSPLTYHGDRDRWARNGNQVRLRTVGRGQEFVLNVSDYPEAPRWIAALFNDASRDASRHSVSV